MKWWAAGFIVLASLSVFGAHFYYEASWGEGCARCHEIRDNFDSWHSSTHRKVNCTACHDEGFVDNVRRVVTHMKGTAPERLHLGADDVVEMVDRCRSCHQQEFAQWKAGPHSTTYARLLTDPEHNRKRVLIDDCLRCHGMHFEGSIRDVVQPIDTRGPWRLRDPSWTNRPAIPCLSCHAIHRQGEPLMKGSQRNGAKQEIVRPSVGLFDRRARMNIAATMLPIPAMFEGTRSVRMSPDARQALCYQCHAPQPDMQVASGDDRTPIGVHEGLSCLACHQKHGQETRASCANCHPRLSNCGLDVEKMDTTFRDPKSPHDVHRVKCTDCHRNGVPQKRV